MSRSKIIQTLKKFKEKYAEKYGILVLGIFGSVARDESKEESDVDVVVKMKKQDLFSLIGIKQDLEEILHVPVILKYSSFPADFLLKYMFFLGNIVNVVA